ncbi:MAG: hypothetical protein DRP45_02025 [Candidatus Zixiibacteriota bacterium]|nr:MAG: hypothetical protein DRP45_02025 [candidate division Zixibacteria bacterium]
MFEALRKMILPIIIIVLFFFLGMIVLQWGLDITRRGPGANFDAAGMVNGEEISWSTFQRTYSNLYQNERGDSDEDIPISRTQQLEGQAWDQLVGELLLRQQADKYNIVATDDDVYLYLRSNPPAYLRQAAEFQTDGQFDYQKYMSYMADPQAAGLWASIEPVVRADIRKIKVQQLVTEAVHVSEFEVKQAFLDAMETIKVGMVNVRSSSLYETVPVPEKEEAREYFDSHREDFTVEERVVLDIVKSSKQATEFDEERARITAQEIQDSANAGADFADLAMRWSDDVGSSANGGDLGWFASGRMVGPFDSAAFAMKEGEVSSPIKTRFGWHVLKHFGYKNEAKSQSDPAVVKKAHVAHVLIKTRASIETIDQAWNQIDQFHMLAGEEGFDAAADELELEVIRTDPHIAQSRIMQLNGDQEALEWAFSNELGAISEIRETDNDYYVIRLAEKVPAGLAEFEDVESDIQKELRTEKLMRLCRDTINVLHKKVQKGTTLTKAAEELELKYDISQSISRAGGMPQVGSDPKAVGAAFALTTVGQISEPIEYSAGTVVFELLQKDTPDLTLYNDKHDSVFTAVVDFKKRRAYTDWFEHLIAQSEIISNVTGEVRRR